MVGWRSAFTAVPTTSAAHLDEGASRDLVADDCRGSAAMLAGLIAPVAVGDIEVTTPFTTQLDRLQNRRRAAVLLVRLHTVPLGVVTLHDLDASGAAARLASRIWAALGPAINEHLAHEGLPAVRGVTEQG